MTWIESLSLADLSYGLVFAAVVSATFALRTAVQAGLGARRRAQAQLRRHGGEEIEPARTVGLVLDRGRAGGVLAGWTRGILTGSSIELFLRRAGLRWSIGRFLGLSALFALAGTGSAALFLGREPIAAVGLVAGLLPTVYGRLRRRARVRLFEAQLPEALDLICRALRAGISLEFGLRSAGEELPDPLGSEFALTAEEISLGLDVRTALANMGARMDTPDMPFFVNAITIQRETGGNLAEILDNLSRIIRDRIKFYGKARALTAQVNLTANLLALMPFLFAGAMYLVFPSYIEPLFEPSGRFFLIAGCVMVPIGWIFCRRIASIDI